MPEITQPAMHPDFARWYREVSIDENRDRLQRRWAGILLILSTLDRHGIESLLRIVFKTRTLPTSESLARIRQAFKDQDDLFDMEGNDRELEILSSSTLAVLLQKDNDLSAWAALAITTSSLNGTRPVQLPLNLSIHADGTIARIAEKNRERPDLRNGSIEFAPLSFSKAKEKLTATDAASIGAALDIVAETMTGALTEFARTVSTSLEAAAHFVAIQDEELEMLWWVIGERSDGMKKSFQLIPEAARPLVLGADLAKATVSLPGPRSIEGLLSRAGLKESQQLTIPDAVNACDRSWLASLIDGKAKSPLSQPIHFAIERRLESQDDTSWIAGWAGGTGVDATQVIPAVTVGKLLYRERLQSIF